MGDYWRVLSIALATVLVIDHSEEKVEAERPIIRLL